MFYMLKAWISHVIIKIIYTIIFYNNLIYCLVKQGGRYTEVVFILGWPKSSFVFSHKMLRKNLNKHFGESQYYGSLHKQPKV